MVSPADLVFSVSKGLLVNVFSHGRRQNGQCMNKRKRWTGSENSEASPTRLVICEWVEPSWASTSQRSSSLKIFVPVYEFWEDIRMHAHVHEHAHTYAHTLKNSTLPLPSPKNCSSHCQSAFHLSHPKILANSREKSSFVYFKSHLITYG